VFTQLTTPVPVHVIDKGSGLAFAVIDYGIEHNLIWVTALDEGGEIWCAPNPKVRVAENWTAGRRRDPVGVDQDSADENREGRG
tara:strand:+ start:113 stop:364 length:252 start_codon:yes stop_codon:yes gene_type:complete